MHHTTFIICITRTMRAIATLFLCLGLMPLPVRAASNLQPQAKVSFTFDDGYTSALTKAAPALAQYGLHGTDYVISRCPDTSTGCPAAPSGASYMTWPELAELRDKYGWEIGSHSATHPLMTSLSAAQLHSEVYDSKQTFIAHGFNPTAFATPSGDYNPTVLAEIAKYYSSHRGFHDQQYYNDWPTNNYLLYVKQVQAGISVDQVKAFIDQAAASNAWLTLVFHNIVDSSPQAYDYATSDLQQIAAYVQSKNLPAPLISEGVTISSDNLLPNSTFDQGLADGWTTDAPTFIKQDAANMGSYPSPTNSLALTGTTRNIHLFSPHVSVDPAKTYLLKSFLTIQTAGEVFYYIDEYDSAGTWISGKYVLGLSDPFVQEASFAYQPTSPTVKTARLQIGLAANANARAYLDNVRWFVME